MWILNYLNIDKNINVVSYNLYLKPTFKNNIFFRNIEKIIHWNIQQSLVILRFNKIKFKIKY